uniref:Uncharacterized protein n=1 Tax=Romanomermis culicivorax TaxID=13658 RepID=A0A915K275_ROMCU
MVCPRPRCQGYACPDSGQDYIKLVVLMGKQARFIIELKHCGTIGDKPMVNSAMMTSESPKKILAKLHHDIHEDEEDMMSDDVHVHQKDVPL